MMKELTYVEALNEALREEMRRDERVFLIGEDIGPYWEGAFKVSKGLAKEFGTERVRDTAISEACIVGAAVGAAMTGMRPVAEIMFGDLLALAMDQIANQAAKIHYMFGGQLKVPVVIRSPFGAGKSIAAHHSQSLEAWFMHTPGLKIAVPSTGYDAKGLLKTAIRDDDPIMFFEHKICYTTKSSIPDEEYLIPFGEANVKREGDNVTIFATFWMVHEALKAAEQLSRKGVEVEIIDPRTLVPLDKQAIIESVKKTGRLIIVEEDSMTCGVGAEIAAIVADEAFDYLESPIKRIAEPDTPIPFSPVLEKYVIPDDKAIMKGVEDLLRS
ncbi:MAG: alpha-ketoacid dehydrogenase subunit beta [Candidatus Bathyarchaeota archaeon]|nr:alpha-ketoacid dehydrogenase subunit beta [Candidatus Bathyarchaeota archaeon]